MECAERLATPYNVPIPLRQRERAALAYTAIRKEQVTPHSPDAVDVLSHHPNFRWKITHQPRQGGGE